MQRILAYIVVGLAAVFVLVQAPIIIAVGLVALCLWSIGFGLCSFGEWAIHRLRA